MASDELYERMLKATPAKNRQQVKELIKKHIQSKGSLQYLQSLLTLGGSLNPLKAFNNIELDHVDFNKDPQIDKDREGERKRGRRLHIPIAKTDTGAKLVHGAIYLRNKSPDSTLVPIGFQAFNKLNSIFGFENVQPIITQKKQREKKQETLEQKTRKAYATQIQEIRDDLKNLEDIQSIAQRRKVQTLLDFEEQLNAAVDLMGNLMFDQRLFSSGDFAELLSLRGSLLTRVANDTNTEQSIRADAEELLDPNIQLPDEEFIYKFNRVRTYAAMTTPINTEKLIGSYLDDAKFIKELPEEFFAENKLEFPKLASVEDIINSRTTTLFNAARVRFIGIERYREFFAQRLLEKKIYKQDYENVLNDTRFLFRKGDGWKLDSVTSVPIRTDFKPYLFNAILNRNELQKLLDVQYHLFASGDDHKQFYMSNSIVNTRSHLNSLVVIKRKLNYLQEHLNEKGEGSVFEKDEEGNRLVSLKDRFSHTRTGTSLPVEWFDQTYGLSLDEVLARMEDVKHDIRHDFSQDKDRLGWHQKRLKYSSDKGFMKKEDIETINSSYTYNRKQVFEGLLDLDPVDEEVHKHRKTIGILAQSELVLVSPYDYANRNFLLPEEKGLLAGYDSVLKDIRHIQKNYTSKEIEATRKTFDDLQQKITRYFEQRPYRSDKWIISGTISKENELLAEKENFDEEKRQQFKTKVKNTTYISSEQFRNLHTLNSSIEKITEELHDKISSLILASNNNKLRTLGYIPFSGKAWGALKNCSAGDYITKHFAQHINTLYEAVGNQ